MKTRKPWKTDKPAQLYYWKLKIPLKPSWSVIRQFGLDLTSSRILRGKEVFLAWRLQSSNSCCLWNEKGRERRLDFSASVCPGFLLKHSYIPVSNQSLFINWLGPASQHSAPSNKGNGCVGCHRVSEVDPVTKARLIDASSRAWVGARGALWGLSWSALFHTSSKVWPRAVFIMVPKDEGYALWHLNRFASTPDCEINTGYNGAKNDRASTEEKTIPPYGE